MTNEKSPLNLTPAGRHGGRTADVCPCTLEVCRAEASVGNVHNDIRVHRRHRIPAQAPSRGQGRGGEARGSRSRKLCRLASRTRAGDHRHIVVDCHDHWLASLPRRLPEGAPDDAAEAHARRSNHVPDKATTTNTTRRCTQHAKMPGERQRGAARARMPLSIARVERNARPQRRHAHWNAEPSLEGAGAAATRRPVMQPTARTKRRCFDTRPRLRVAVPPTPGARRTRPRAKRSPPPKRCH